MIKTIIAIMLAITSVISTSNNEVTVEGKFTPKELAFENGTTWYQFKSDDNSVWWILKEEEIGHKPTLNDKYLLTYNHNGTTETDLEKCGCLAEWECECYLYDDVFIKIVKK